MKKIYKMMCVILILLCGLIQVRAQIAEWVIRPKYDAMYFPTGTDLVITDSAGQSNLWSLDGKLLLNTSGKFHPFHDDMSVITNRYNTDCIGFVNIDGDSVLLNENFNLRVFAKYPYFSEGYLLVTQELKWASRLDNRNVYQFIDKIGGIKMANYGPEFYAEAYPFFNGYASCRDFDKHDDPRLDATTPCLLSTDMRPVQFTYKNKLISASDLDFISSVNDEHIAIVIRRKDVYIYNTEKKELKPLYAKENCAECRNQAELLSRSHIENLKKKNDTTWVMTASCGRKEGVVSINFDEFMRPCSIEYTDGTRYFQKHKVEQEKISSPLKTLFAGKKRGLAWEDEEILPPQFDKIYSCKGDKAIISTNGKFGLLKLFRSKDKDFEVIIGEKGKDALTFLHKQLTTTIRAEFPNSISEESVSIINMNDASSELEIDKYSIDVKKTKYGSYVQYSCNLGIPQILFEKDTATVEYPIQIIYEGLVSPVRKVKRNVNLYSNWSLKSKTDGEMKDGVYSFDFELNNSHQDEDVYRLQVELRMPEEQSFDTTPKDSNYVETSCRLQKFSETSYRCTVTGLHQGINEFAIEVAEEGMPAKSFPIAITFTKTEITKGKGKNAHTEIEEKTTLESKEAVTVRKRKPRQQVQPKQATIPAF